LQTRFDDNSSLAEEKKFLKDYTIPFVQLDPKKSILVFSHIHNSFDKKELLKTIPNPTIHETTVVPTDLIKNKELLNFFIDDIDQLLEFYEPGNPINKPDVLKQMQEIKAKREIMMNAQTKEQQYNQHKINSIIAANPQVPKDKENQTNLIIRYLLGENKNLTEKADHLNAKIKELITEKIKERTTEKEPTTENNTV